MNVQGNLSCVTSIGFADLQEVYGESFPRNKRQLFDQQPPPYEKVGCKECEEENDTTTVETLRNLQPNQRLRIIDGKLIVEKRWFSSVTRTLTKDNRWAILEKLQSLLEASECTTDRDAIIHALEVLANSTYKNDKQFRDKATQTLQRNKL